MKVRTIRRWWIVGAAMAVLTLIVVAWNCWQALPFLGTFDDYLNGSFITPRAELSEAQVATMRRIWDNQSDVGRIAATIYTSGQTVGLLIAALVGAFVLTSEFQHRTLAATLLATPRRRKLISAKLLAAIVAAGGVWLAAAVTSLVGGAIFLSANGVGFQLADPEVQVALLLNLGAYLVWGIFGFGIAALLRNQVITAVATVGLYFLTSVVVAFIFNAIHEFLIEEDWVLKAQVLLPGVASQVLTTPNELFPGAPPQWTGAVVLAGYGLLAALAGLSLLYRRDVA